MTALQLHEARKQIRRVSLKRTPTLTAVRQLNGAEAMARGVAKREVSTNIVRPDRPYSTQRVALCSVPTVDSAAEPVGGWKLELSKPAPRLSRSTVRPGATAARQAGSSSHSLPWMNGVEMGVRILVVLAIFSAIFVATLIGAYLLGVGPSVGDAIYVQAGDSLWSIAAGLGVEADTAQIVADIKSMNGLIGEQVTVGQELVIPRY